MIPPTNDQPTKPVQPSKESLYGPTASVAREPATVLREPCDSFCDENYKAVIDLHVLPESCTVGLGPNGEQLCQAWHPGIPGP